jgi:hypothetical protein
MIRDRMKMEISKYHKTRLSVSMRVLENTVYEMEELVRDSNGRKTMTETVNNLTQRERDMILKRIVEIKESINYIAEHLNLTRRKVEAKNLILGAMTVERVNLDEMKSKGLRVYGEVPDDLREFLDPQAEKMIALVDEICMAAEGISEKERI